MSVFLSKPQLWMNLLSGKSADTYAHCIRVARLARMFASYSGLCVSQQNELVRGCYLHDIGKLLMPDSLLNGSEKLDEQGWQAMRLHPLRGGELLESLEKAERQGVIEVVMHHHERWDGAGYPAQWSGEQIPVHARICSVLDAFDCMMAGRRYRAGMCFERVVAELRANAGTQFDPHIVLTFIAFLEDTSDVLKLYPIAKAS